MANRLNGCRCGCQRASPDSRHIPIPAFNERVGEATERKVQMYIAVLVMVVTNYLIV